MYNSLMLKGWSVWRFMLFVISKIKYRTSMVCLFHTISYLLYCLLSLDVFEKFTETIEYTMQSSITITDLVSNHFFNHNLGLYWFSYWILLVLCSAILDFASSYLSSVLYSHSEYFVRCTIIQEINKSKLVNLKGLNESVFENFIDLLAEGIRETIEKVTHDIFPGMFFVICGIIKLFLTFNFKIGISFLSLSIFFMFIQFKLFKRAIEFAQTISITSSARTSTIVEALRYILFIKFTQSEKFLESRVSEIHLKETEACQRFHESSSWTTLSTYIFNIISKIIVIGSLVFVGISEYNRNSIAVVYKCSQLISWIVYTISDKCKDITDVMQSIIQTRTAYDFICSKITTSINNTSQSLKNLDGYHISIKNLHIEYEGRTIIKDLSVEIPEGSIVSIVGASGSGKSTICNTLLKLTNFTSGSISIGSVNINDITDQEITRICRYMDQRDGLFCASIKDNITLGRNIVGYNEIINKTHLRDLINRVGDDFNVGNHGEKVSGGERRRIGIARAFICEQNENGSLIRKPITLLDEMNTGLDSKTSLQIFFDTLKFVQEERSTTFIIDHSHNATSKSDIIIFLHQQKAIVGKHDDLMRDSEEYSSHYLACFDRN